MKKAEFKQPVGSLRISQEVVATIASYALKEIDGVAGLATFSSNIKHLFTQKRVLKSIEVEITDDVAEISLNVNLKNGAKIPVVAEEIQTAVKEAVQNMTGITVAKVNVNIAGIVFEQEQPVLE